MFIFSENGGHRITVPVFNFSNTSFHKNFSVLARKVHCGWLPLFFLLLFHVLNKSCSQQIAFSYFDWARTLCKSWVEEIKGRGLSMLIGRWRRYNKQNSFITFWSHVICSLELDPTNDFAPNSSLSCFCLLCYCLHRFRKLPRHKLYENTQPEVGTICLIALSIPQKQQRY